MFSKVTIFALFVAVVHSSGINGGYTSFSYGVADPHTGDVKSQQETRSGGNVVGQYSLIDSDGTRRTVDYAANPHTGFNAVVRKEPIIAHGPVVAAPISTAYARPYAYATPIAHSYATPIAHSYASPVAHSYATSYASPVVRPYSPYARSYATYAAPLSYATAPIAYNTISTPLYKSYATPIAHYGGYGSYGSYGAYGYGRGLY